MGKEKTEGQKIVALSKADFLPVIEMLERDNQIQLPRIGVVQPGSSKNQVKLAQLGDGLDDEDQLIGLGEWSAGLGDGDEETMLQINDDVPEYFQESEEGTSDGDQMPYTILA